ncbi:MAG TPA: ABC transporter permease [Puia sp.]|jgi:putative ABC transport system permease protein|nr:ABC transporter permease [Puia sp.]
MLKNYLTIAWRNLWKNPTFTLLNLGGLTISLTACLLIFFWVMRELSFDTAGSHADRVYRVGLTLQVKAQPDKSFAETAGPLAPVLVKDFPQIEKAVRMAGYNARIGYRGEHFFAQHFFFADSSFFDVFGYRLVEGDPHTALNGSNSVVITEGLARKYFGNEDPIGKLITCSDSILLKVTGVSKELPATQHFVFDMICSMRVLEHAHLDDLTAWWDDDYYTYIRLKNAADAPAVNAGITHIMDRYNGDDNKAGGMDGLHFLQPLKSIHLHSNFMDELSSNGSISALRIFIAVAVFLLVVAGINYVNLTTATSFRRAREIGIRKVAGAEQRQLVVQFLSESILITLIAGVAAFGLMALCLPLFNRLAATDIGVSDYFSWQPCAVLVVFLFVLGVVAGIFPAFYLSSAGIVKVMKKGFEKKGSLLPMREVLVVFQFTLAILLIVSTIVMGKQLRYMQTLDVGFDREQVVAIPLPTTAEALLKDRIKTELQRDPSVLAVAASSTIPGRQFGNIVTLPEGVPGNQMMTMNTLVVDIDFIQAYKMNMAAGRSFSASFPTDSGAFLLNETAVREIGWGRPENAIGKGIDWGLGKKGKIIGVVKDFHFTSLRQKTAPVIMHIMPAGSGWYGFLSVRIDARNAKQAIAGMKNVWKRLLPGDAFGYFFVNETYNKLYETEQRLGSLSLLFSLLTIFISSLGLFGLVMVAVSRRVKEIGVRKVLGASVTGITALLSRDFLRLVVIANFVALPLSWWLMHQWLGDFAYRIGLSWWMFALAAVLVILIALVTVSFQTVRAAMANPVRSLRSE